MGIEFFKWVIEFLNRNNGAFSLVFSAVLAIATIVLALETRRIKEAQKEPKIFVSIQPEEGRINWFDIVIQNIGLGAAYNIKFEVNPDFEYAKGKFLSGLVFIKNGLKYLGPNNEFRCPLIFFKSEEVEKTFEINTTYQINFTYQNITGKTYKGEYSIDSSQLISIGLTQLELDELPLYKIARNIEKIATCKEIQEALNSIAVNTITIVHFLSQKPINEEDVKKEQNNR
jgi:hypothetical protein